MVGKGQFAAGSRAVYIEPDYVVPLSRSEFAFLLKGREDKTEHRMRAVRLRGQLSFGLLIPVPEELAHKEVGDDVMTELGIRRYEPPVKFARTGADDTLPHTDWPKLYTPKFDLESLNNFPDVFQPGEQVIVTEKIHGSNAKCVWHNSEFYVGTRNRWVQTVNFRSPHVHALDNVLIRSWCAANPNVILWGEAYGPLSELRYGLTNPGFVAFAALENDKWWDLSTLFASLDDLGIPHVPVLYHGPFDRDKIVELAEGDSLIETAPSGHMMEGIVIVPAKERHDPNLGRVALKLISNRYWEG